MHPPSFEVSESDPQYSLKSFIGNIILKAELLMEIEDFLCGSAHDFEPKPDEIHDHADPLRDYLDRHTDYIRSYVAYHEDLMLKLVRVNASLLHDAVACARWEMTSTTLDPEAAQEYATDICVLAQEAVRFAIIPPLFVLFFWCKILISR